MIQSTTASSTRIAPTLSIVIVNWNTRDLLDQCLRSLKAHLDVHFPAPDKRPVEQRSTGLIMEVKVVDNGSTDGSIDMITAQFPQVHLLQNRKNVGFARANNMAIRECEGRYVLLLNPDTEIMPGALEVLLGFANAHPEAGAIGPQLLNVDGSLQESCHPAPTLFGELWQLFHLHRLWPHGIYEMARWDLETHRQVDVLKGACLLLRRQALEQVGMLDEDYFMYSEEVDLCARLQEAGWSLYWVPMARVVHYGGQSTKQVAAEMFMELYRSKMLYFRKRRGPLAAQTYKAILTAAAVSRLLLSPFAWLGLFPQREWRLTLARRYLRLLRAMPRL